MKIGDYVRYVDVFNNTIKIRKINKIIPPDKLIKKDVYFFNNKECSLKENIIKSSPNIIDLIEVGDYVNGHKVFDDMRVDTDDYGNDFIEIGIEIDNMLNHYIREEDIKSIVTKEQFESMKYEVE